MAFRKRSRSNRSTSNRGYSRRNSRGGRRSTSSRSGRVGRGQRTVRVELVVKPDGGVRAMGQDLPLGMMQSAPKKAKQPI